MSPTSTLIAERGDLVTDQTPIIILAGLQADGTTYQLHPSSRNRVRERFPSATQAPSVFVGYETQADFESLHGPMWGQIAMMLTGLSLEKLEGLGHVVVRVATTGREFEVGRAGHV